MENIYIFMLSTFNCLVTFSVFIHLLKYSEADLLYGIFYISYFFNRHDLNTENVDIRGLSVFWKVILII